MPTFSVGLTQLVAEKATIQIEAETAEQAEELALAKAMSGEVDWEFMYAEDGIEISDVNRVG